ncbi:MAG: VacJ family lipoprotein [Alphaproteobacteria bacterium]|nr:VacJ family lipoprotein [Alphaproteobacteria bacterium]OJV46975.1 MAG: hypothetical protein BGO28_06525 [Alphaproteobacteria bacterium 43-37]
MKTAVALLLVNLLCFIEAGARPLPDSFDKKAILTEAQVGERQGLRDPFEPVNRSILYFNRLADGLVIKPLGLFYRNAVPSPIRQGVGNFLGNLTTPIEALNHTLQGQGKKAGKQFFRFILNTVIGICGIFDPATHMGFKKDETDFDTTFAKAGIPSGPYLMLPLLGPSTPRHALGRVLSLVLDPFNRIAIYNDQRNFVYYRSGIQIVHTRSEHHKLLETLEADPTYMYETMRSVYSEMVRAKENRGDKPYSGPKPSDSWQ